jgi:plastocyanin
MTKLITAALCLALASGALAACGDDDEEEAGTAPPSTTPTATAPGPQGGEVRVSMKDIKFKPRDAKVKAGQKIVWTNDDPVAHTVTATTGAKFDSGTVQPGARYEQTIDKRGKIDYVCTIHPNQTGTVTVQ